MAWYHFALWGFLGGFIVEGTEYWRFVRSTGRGLPENIHWPAYVLAEALRLISGAILAVALGLSNQVSGEAGALTVGIAAPLLIDRLSQEVPKLPPPRGPDTIN